MRLKIDGLELPPKRLIQSIRVHFAQKVHKYNVWTKYNCLLLWQCLHMVYYLFPKHSENEIGGSWNIGGELKIVAHVLQGRIKYRDAWNTGAMSDDLIFLWIYPSQVPSRHSSLPTSCNIPCAGLSILPHMGAEPNECRSSAHCRPITRILHVRKIHRDMRRETNL